MPGLNDPSQNWIHPVPALTRRVALRYRPVRAAGRIRQQLSRHCARVFEVNCTKSVGYAVDNGCRGTGLGSTQMSKPRGPSLGKRRLRRRIPCLLQQSSWGIMPAWRLPGTPWNFMLSRTQQARGVGESGMVQLRVTPDRHGRMLLAGIQPQSAPGEIPGARLRGLQGPAGNRRLWAWRDHQ